MTPGGLDPCIVGDEPCEPLPGDVLVPEAKWSSLARFIRDCAEYQDLAQVVLDTNNHYWIVTLSGALTAQASRLDVDKIATEVGLGELWETWEVVLVVVGSIATGLLVGGLVGAVAVWI